VLLVLDEIYTGFGRTGRWFACEHEGVTPDLICLGKAMTGGFPLSACVGKADLMDEAWPVSDGEAIHTSTYLGHPVGCAMALAQIGEITRRKLPAASARLGAWLGRRLDRFTAPPGFTVTSRGLGLMRGIELRRSNGAPATREALGLIKSMLHQGFILLPEGAQSNVISMSPPLTISQARLETCLRVLQRALTALSVPGP
jgi:4-aminobutyrate aminotransferase-like enzyme